MHHLDEIREPRPSPSSAPSIDDDEETMAKVAQIADGIAFPMTMQAAIELGLLDIISAAGPGAQLTAAEVAAKLQTTNPQAAQLVDRMLRLLAAFSVVSCSFAGGERQRVYGMTAVSSYFVKGEDGVSMGPLLLLHQDNVMLQSWYRLKDAVLEGGGTAFDKAHGMNAFQYPGVDERYNKVFNLGMFSHTTIVMKKILDSYKGFEDIKQLVDVGGGIGHSLKIILSKYPHLKAINLDLPHVIHHGLSHPGMEHQGGDMFERVPNAEAVFMKWILHDWDDSHCVLLLKNCHRAIAENGKVIVVELIATEEPETTTLAKYVHEKDMIMMSQTPGGKERTKVEFIELGKAAGFAGVRFECHVCNLMVMEFYK